MMNSAPYPFLTSLQAYQPPPWVSSAILPTATPASRVPLGRFPTPIHPWKVSGLEDFDTYIKRDDLSSFDLSGNKVRKLEFLMAEAKEGAHDCVITAGGVQSNHCRATAVAARQMGLDPYLILRIPKGQAEEEIGLVGNLLLDRLVGAKIKTVTVSQYAQFGSDFLLEQLAQQLRDEGRNPYVIPVGGSNALGAFGYMGCVQEILEAQEAGGGQWDHIVFGCGSGGTAAGLALGMLTSGLCRSTQLHAVGVCDSPYYFYNHIQEVAVSLGLAEADAAWTVEDNLVSPFCRIYQGQGIGYAKSTPEELQFLVQLAATSGILLDPVYSGKALYHWVEKVVKAEREKPGTQDDRVFKAGQRILFIHTGGTLGLFDKVAELLPLLPRVSRLDMPPLPLPLSSSISISTTTTTTTTTTTAPPHP